MLPLSSQYKSEFILNIPALSLSFLILWADHEQIMTEVLAYLLQTERLVEHLDSVFH